MSQGARSLLGAEAGQWSSACDQLQAAARGLAPRAVKRMRGQQVGSEVQSSQSDQPRPPSKLANTLLCSISKCHAHWSITTITGALLPVHTTVHLLHNCRIQPPAAAMPRARTPCGCRAAPSQSARTPRCSSGCPSPARFSRASFVTVRTAAPETWSRSLGSKLRGLYEVQGALVGRSSARAARPLARLRTQQLLGQAPPCPPPLHTLGSRQ